LLVKFLAQLKKLLQISKAHLIFHSCFQKFDKQLFFLGGLQNLNFNKFSILQKPSLKSQSATCKQAKRCALILVANSSVSIKLCSWRAVVSALKQMAPNDIVWLHLLATKAKFTFV
jgi:hypothetical protein